MRAMGLRDFTLPPRLRPLNPEGVLTGPAFTIEGRIVEGADPHETLLAWTGLLSQCPGGHVWTAQPNNQLVAQMGELSAETLHLKGVLGVVTDGGLRDTNFILRLGLPCWGTFFTPRDVVGLWLPTATGTPISIDAVTINPGDWVHGDRDGMVVIPAAHLDEVIEKGVAAMQTESKVRAAILQGIDPQQAYLSYGKF
ncbi:MAG: RraA family protein [Limimaricola sp.]|nr:RraA family protein [Limimaricola sp.]